MKSVKIIVLPRKTSTQYLFIIPGQYTNNDANKFKTIVIFDCRGVEPVDFEPKSGWLAEAEENGKS